MTRYNLEINSYGENISRVDKWAVHYPTSIGGRLADVGWVAPIGSKDGNSGFVHFDFRGEPYGHPLTKKARKRLKQLRRDFPFGYARNHTERML